MLSKSARNIDTDVSEEVKRKKPLTLNDLLSSRAQIWKSWTSWRIAAVVFMTIALVQACLLVFGTMGDFENRRLQDLRESGRSAIVPEVAGRAWITGRHEFLLAPDDPLRDGFLIR